MDDKAKLETNPGGDSFTDSLTGRRVIRYAESLKPNRSMPTAHTPLPWKVRRHPDLGCFIEARIPGKPYGQEIMGDDYFPDLSREADAEFIVKCVTEVSALRAALVEHRDCTGIHVREVDGQLQLACCARTHGGGIQVLFPIP